MQVTADTLVAKSELWSQNEVLGSPTWPRKAWMLSAQSVSFCRLTGGCCGRKHHRLCGFGPAACWEIQQQRMMSISPGQDRDVRTPPASPRPLREGASCAHCRASERSSDSSQGFPTYVLSSHMGFQMLDYDMSNTAADCSTCQSLS